MESGIFSTTIKDGWIELQTAADAALFSFIVHDSVSYLDLKLCKTSMISDYFSLFCDSCRSRPLINFVNTEEKCRQFFSPRRRLLYTLHLDLPKGRECSLKEECSIEISDDNWYCCERVPIAEISLTYGFYDEILSNFIEEALNVNVPKQDILKWILKIPFCQNPLLSRLDFRIASKFIDCFYPEVTDYALLSDFITQFDVIEWMEEYEQPEILEFLLYHARLFGNISLQESAEDCISVCICYKHYLNIRPILKYTSDSKPTNFSYNYYFLKLSSVRPQMAQNVRYVADTAKGSKERLCRLMQVILTYTDSQGGLQEAASEALRLIWNSIPDAWVTYAELKDVFGASLSDQELWKVFVFYAKVIGEFPERVQPHPLQHLCRIILRKTFEENNLWIPDAISRTGLPKSLQSFLNLEKQFGY